jgi:hypothetical protein
MTLDPIVAVPTIFAAILKGYSSFSLLKTNLILSIVFYKIH